MGDPVHKQADPDAGSGFQLDAWGVFVACEECSWPHSLL